MLGGEGMFQTELADPGVQMVINNLKDLVDLLGNEKWTGYLQNT